jgi:hypothetical protein
MSSSDRFFDNSIDSLFATGFSNADRKQIASHLKIDQYDQFQLTAAVRPAIDLHITPFQGYRHDVYIDEETGARIPVIMAAATREILFSLFMDLIRKLGPMVDVVLETSHDSESGKHVDYYREQIDMPVLTSCLWEFEDLLTNDGCSGIAVLNPNTPQEVQFDEHKLIIVYGSPLEQFEHVLECRGVFCQPQLKFITEAEHIHTSSEAYQMRFQQLRTELGLDGSREHGLDCDLSF